MRLRINNLDTAYTIDTYGFLTGESVDEMEAEYYREEYGLDNAEFDYNHAGIVESLANSSVSILWSEFVGKGIIQDITLISSRSPQFYNYTTDSYIAEWKFDADKLSDYITTNREDFDKWFPDSGWASEDISDNEYQVYLDFYTRNEYSSEDYDMAIGECEYEAYLENMKLDTESAKRLEKLV